MVSNTIEELTSLGSSASQHKELASARVERDNNDSLKILIWFRKHNPFTTSEKLVMSGFWIYQRKQHSNCDKTETIGARIQKLLDNEVFTSWSFKTKDQITNLQILYSSIMIDK